MIILEDRISVRVSNVVSTKAKCNECRDTFPPGSIIVRLYSQHFGNKRINHFHPKCFRKEMRSLMDKYPNAENYPFQVKIINYLIVRYKKGMQIIKLRDKIKLLKEF